MTQLFRPICPVNRFFCGIMLIMEHYILHFDGSCGPQNPGGTAAYGYILSQSGKRLTQNHAVIGSGPAMSNNLAEFHALAAGLYAMLDIQNYLNITKQGSLYTGAHLQVYGDSKLVINIMNKKWKAHADGLYYPAALDAFAAVNKLRRANCRVFFDWIPRERNTAADDLSKAHYVKIALIGKELALAA